MKKILFMLLVTAFVVFSGQVLAKDGLYMGMDLGVAVAPDVDIKTGGLDDWSTSGSGTRCDATINPDRLQGGACTNDPRTWGPATESFDGGSGILAGLAVGYRLGSFRVEGEYFYRGTRYGSTAEPYFPDDDWSPSDSREYGGGGAMQEYGGGAEDAVDNLMSHNFFANLYYDYRTDSKFTPYAGFGIGFA
ncbi:MAG: hypothetical protein OXI53_00305 [Nitrospira sp.]|nr:hypothetical protein [Nitrospira sp.]